MKGCFLKLSQADIKTDFQHLKSVLKMRLTYESINFKPWPLHLSQWFNPYFCNITAMSILLDSCSKFKVKCVVNQLEIHYHTGL